MCPMSIFLSLALTLIGTGITLACLSVLVVRLLSTKMLIGVMTLSLVISIYSGFVFMNQVDNLIKNLSPSKIIKSIDLFS